MEEHREGYRLPKPDWDKFNPRVHQPPPHPRTRPPPPPRQKRPTIFSSYYIERERRSGSQTPYGGQRNFGGGGQGHGFRNNKPYVNGVKKDRRTLMAAPLRVPPIGSIFNTKVSYDLKYLPPKFQGRTSTPSKVIAITDRRTDRQTDRQTEHSHKGPSILNNVNTHGPPFTFTPPQGQYPPPRPNHSRSQRVAPQTHQGQFHPSQHQNPNHYNLENASRSRPQPIHEESGGGGSRGGAPYRGRGHGAGRIPFKRNTGTRHSNNSGKKQGQRDIFISKSLQKVQETSCCECEEPCASYKCPKCLRKYCSLPCYKIHKSEANCVLDEESKLKHDRVQSCQKARVSGRVEYLYPTGDTIKPEGLEMLTREPLRSKIVELMKSERIRDKIRSLDSSKDPRGLMNSFVEDREFSEFKTFVITSLSNDLFS